MSDFIPPPSSASAGAVVPRPRSSAWSSGRFAPSAAPDIQGPAEAAEAIARLRSGLGKRCLDVTASSVASKPAEFVLAQAAEAMSGGAEAYALTIDPTGVTISARTAAGWGHGVQTLLDLYETGTRDWPLVRIEDAPRFAWRGMLLDCCRHFVSPAIIRRILDGMAAGKMNRFHWHLTDDQAWRIEIKRYPRLTEIGARRSDESEGRNQFYSQDDVREIVRYAARLGIEVVPEIEMPGHATAALACYPELGCHVGPYEVKARWGLFPHNFNAGNDRVFEFLENVLREVIELFPFPFIHLGADECDKTEWENCPDCQRRMRDEGLADETALQSYFVNRIAGFLQEHGRTAIGWDEILEGEPLPGMMVQAWRDERIIKSAADRGFPVIASPRRYCYLDMALSQIDLRDVLRFDPTHGLDPAAAKMVQGAEANMWTEYVDESDLVQMIFPRLWGLSEVLWCGPHPEMPFAEFKTRVDRLAERARVGGLQPGPALREEVNAGEMKGRTDLDEPAPGVERLI